MIRVSLPSSPATEGDFAQDRLPERIYVSKRFDYPFASSSDRGQPSRYVRQVFDEPVWIEEPIEVSSDLGDRLAGVEEEHVVYENRRTQMKLWMVRDAGRVKQLRVERVPVKRGKEVEVCLDLTGDNCQRLIELIQIAGHVSPEGADPEGYTIDRSVVERLQENPDALVAVYEASPEIFRELMRNDVKAEDVVALSHRREVVAEFKQLLTDDAYFDEMERQSSSRGDEAVWQKFFERNPWILGASLSSQILTSWSQGKLEQVVAGNYGNNRGKRVDGLLETNGIVGSLVFAEIKTHRTDLLDKEYRGECWAPSEHLSGGVAQIQGTVQRALYDLQERLQKKDDDGSDIPGEFSYLVRPRSYLIIGSTAEFKGLRGGDHREKIRSFELFRRHTEQPEVVTFDELLARAEWNVEAASAESA